MAIGEFSYTNELNIPGRQLVLSRETALKFHRRCRVAAASGRPYPQLTEIPRTRDGRTSLKRLAQLLELPTPLQVDVFDGRQRPNSRYVNSRVIDRRTPSLPICPGLSVVSPEEALFQTCGSKNLARQALLAYELCGSFAIPLAEKDGFVNGLVPLTTPQLIGAHADSKDVSRCSPKYLAMHRIVNTLVANAASPAEARICLAIVAPRTLGGQGFPKPELNAEIQVERSASALTQRHIVRPDELWRELKLILEYMGSHHAEMGRMGEDASRDNTLSAMGYKVIHVTKRQVQDPYLYRGLMDHLRVELGIRQDIPSHRILERQEALRAFLFGTQRSKW